MSYTFFEDLKKKNHRKRISRLQIGLISDHFIIQNQSGVIRLEILPTENIRESRKHAPFWMILNLIEGKCWCGKPKHLWEPRQRKYCSGKHMAFWHSRIHPFWSVYREQKLYDSRRSTGNIQCEWCKNTTKIMHIDHIIPLMLGGDMWDSTNHQILCAPCHHKKTKIDHAVRTKYRRDFLNQGPQKPSKKRQEIPLERYFMD